MKKSIKTLSAFILTAAVAFASVSSVSAYKGDASVQGPNYSPERHDAMTAAFANKDYGAWQDLMSQNDTKGRVFEKINEDNFATFAEAHQLMLEGKTEEAKAKRAELGLGLRDGSGNGEYKNAQRGGRGRSSGQGRNAK